VPFTNKQKAVAIVVRTGKEILTVEKFKLTSEGSQQRK
jgi:hypothetical protein